MQGLRVTVVGAARSGVAAAELLARHGARVTLSEQADVIAEADRLRRAGRCSSRSAGTGGDAWSRRDLVVLSPGVPLEQPFVWKRATAGVPRHRRDRAGVPLAEEDA